MKSRVAGFEYQKIVRSAITVAVLLPLMVACGGSGSSTGPYPSDEQLIAHFNSNRATFELLASNLSDAKLATSLGIMVIRNNKLIAWQQDLFGPGGCAKGYAYGKPPAADSVVKSIDQATQPCGPVEHTLYRHVEGDWYLYYSSNN
jgi:hypothetical protein